MDVSSNTSGQKRPDEAPPTSQRPLKMQKLRVSQLAKTSRPESMSKQMAHFKLERDNPESKVRKPRKQTSPELVFSTAFKQVVEDTKSRCKSLLATQFMDEYTQWAIFERCCPTATSSPLATRNPVRNPRMIIHANHQSPDDVMFRFEVHFVTLHCGMVSDPMFEYLLQTLLPDSNYCLCAGLPESVGEQLNFFVKNARKWGLPFNRIDHEHCKLWFPFARETSQLRREPTCELCTKLFHYANRRIKAQSSVQPSERDKRAQPSSRYPIKYLPYDSQQLRAARRRKETFKTKKIVRKYRNQRNNLNTREAKNGELMELASSSPDES